MASLLWLLVGALPTGPAAAQDAGALSTGYAPDPLVLGGETRGAQPLNALATGCRGYVGAEPDAVLRLETRFGFLRMFVIAPRPVTLAVRDSAGQWHCSGRPMDGAPREQGTFEPGRLEVWIGSTESGTRVPYELRITEFGSVTPATGSVDGAAPVGGGSDLGLRTEATEGRFRGRRLRRGFLPDPRVDLGTSGGRVDVRALGGRCAGLVMEQPSHVLDLQNDLDYFRIQLGRVSGAAALVVRSPGGRWFCSAPSDDDARIERDAWPMGSYQIWVGLREPGPERDYHICYTEVRPPEGGIICGRRGTAGARSSTPVGASGDDADE